MARTPSYLLHRTANQGPRQIRWASETQRELFEYGPAPVCASGGFGSSKTYGLCLKAMVLSDQFPVNRGVIARKVLEDLKATTMSTFFKVCPPEAYSRGGRRVDGDKYLRLNNGSEILWMHLDDPERENIIKGLEINWFLIDQAEEVEEEIFTKMCSRLGRWDKTIVPPELMVNGWDWFDADGRPIPPTYAMIACNPDVEFHWIYRRFHPDSEEWQDTYSKEGYKMFTMSSLDNRFLPQQNRQALLSQDQTFIDRYVYGKWGVPEGRIHTLHPDSLIEYTPERLDYVRKTCSLHRVLDHGDSSPTCCAWAGVDRGGNIIWYREYYRPNALVSEHRVEITAMSQGESYTFNIADPSIFDKVQQKHGGRWSTADEYSDSSNYSPLTALHWIAGDNNEFGTRNRISEYLKFDPDHINPFTGQRGSPRMFFIQRSQEYPAGCNMLVRETRAQRREKVGTELGRPIFSDDRDESIPDHAYDTVRYLVASRPPVRFESKQLYSKRSYAKVREGMLKFQRRGGFKALARAARRGSIR